MAGDTWSQHEVEAVVADYFAMLDLELRGIPYSKAEHRRNLRLVLNGRSDGSVERKHSNVSAVLVELGFPYLRGYKPLHNYQHALVDAVASQLSRSSNLERTVRSAVEATATVPSVDDILSLLVSPPVIGRSATPIAREAVSEWRVRRGVNYLECEARNSSLGRAGEELVVNFEVARLRHAGADKLADKVEHVALTVGDGLGFDVRSFNIDGREQLIEVKTTNYGILTPFYVSPNELRVSQSRSSAYQLYRLFDFSKSPHLFALHGAIDRGCSLEPSQYLARVG